MNTLNRLSQDLVSELLAETPVVGLVGPRQVGKSTLARKIARAADAVFVDLQIESTREALADPTQYLRLNANKLVVLDEVQRMPALFSALRPIIDEDRRPGRFLLLGSASPRLMRSASESLAGRIFYHELSPLSYPEARGGGIPLVDHFVRGGYPEALLGKPGRRWRRWVSNYVMTFITRDLSELGIRADVTEFGRLASLLAHQHGGQFSASELARSLRVSSPTVQRYVDILEGAFLIRVLRPYLPNLSKRLVKRPRIYWRDSGLRHGLLDIETAEQLYRHPAVGSSWEGYAIEEICRALGEFARAYYYRTSNGAELDLVIEIGGGRRLAFEFKFNTARSLTKGTYAAIADVNPEETFVITADGPTLAIREGLTSCSLDTFLLEHAPTYAGL